MAARASMARTFLIALLATGRAANRGGGSSNPDPLKKNKDGSLHIEEFGRVHAHEGLNMIQRAAALHDTSYVRGGKTKATSQCHSVVLSTDGGKLRAQNRSILLLVQTMTASKSNLCEGSRADWRDGMAQCLHQLTGLRVVVHNDDGTCADCGSLERTACISHTDPPPGLVVVLGGGEDKRLRFLCANHYCGNTGDPFWVDAGRNAPSDFLGACDAYAFDRQGNRILGAAQVSLKADPPTKIAWLPLVNPHAEIRGLYERNLLYASDKDPDAAGVPRVTRPQNIARLPDVVFQRRVIEPAFRLIGGHAPIEIIRDDALPKPILLPPRERAIYDEASVHAQFSRERTLIYVGSYRPNKGQLDFLRIIDRKALGPFRLEFYGARQAEVGGDDYEALQREVEARWQGKVVLHDAKLKHEDMVRVMAKSSGLIHFSNGDRNPRVLYEALMFGLPVFVSVQAMPYIGLQCQPFVTLTDTNGTKEEVAAHLRRFVKYLTDSEKFKQTARKMSTNGTKPWLFRKLHNAQQAIRLFVEEELAEHFVYATFCQRFGICGSLDLVRDPRTPWVRRGKCRRSLNRFENWKAKPWGAHVEIKRSLNIVVAPKCVLMWGRNCRDACRSRNLREYRKVSPRQWWQPNQVGASDHDAQETIKLRWKKNRKSRVGLGLEAEAGAAFVPRFDESGERVKSAGAAGEALLALGLQASSGAPYTSRRDAAGKLLPGEDFVARRKAERRGGN